MALLEHHGDQEKLIKPQVTVATVRALLQQAFPEKELSLEPVTTTIDGSFSAAAFFDGVNGSGKGLSADQALASALMECLERYSWLRFDYENHPDYIYASYNDLAAAGKPLVPPEYFFANFIKTPLNDSYLDDLLTVKMRWLPAKDLCDDSVCYYPFNYQSLLYSSNGLAAGNDCIEAAVQAICELFERQAIRDLYLDGRPGRLIDQDAITSEYARYFLKAAAEAGIDFDLLDVGGSYGLPVIIARGHDRNKIGSVYEWGVGQGCCINAELAINRALSEYAEGRSQMERNSKRINLDFELLKLDESRDHKGFYNTLNPENFRWVGSAVDPAVISGPMLTTAEDQLSWLLARGAAVGYHFYGFDLTSPLLKIPVVRVFSPFMGSIINTAWEHPESLLAAVYYEGGRLKEAQRFSLNGMSYNPQLKEFSGQPLVASMLPALFAMLPPEELYGRDYRDNILSRGQIKSQGLGFVNKKLNNINAVMESLIKHE